MMSLPREEGISYTASDVNLLGKGSGGARVYKGKYGRRDVAVKQLIDLLDEAKAYAEIDKLVKLDGHKNILRYYGHEIQNNRYLLAVELGKANLQQWIDNPNCIEPAITTKQQILKDITEGLHYLHKCSLIHRDLKPTNVILVVTIGTNDVVAKISDFSISQLIDPGRKSKTLNSVDGTESWMAPELLKFNDDERKRRKNKGDSSTIKTTMTQKVDIFSLGCVFYFVLTEGDHPFGDTDIPYHIKRNEIKMDGTKVEVSRNLPLLNSMLEYEKDKRPDVQSILSHQLFWNHENVLEFIVAVSDFVQDMMSETLNQQNAEGNPLPVSDSLSQRKRDCIKKLETSMKTFLDPQNDMKWSGVLQKDLQSYLKTNKFNKNYLKSGLGLLRVVRNLGNHFDELPADIRNVFVNKPNGYMEYWLQRFPLLLHHVRSAFQCLSSEAQIKEFY